MSVLVLTAILTANLSESFVHLLRSFRLQAGKDVTVGVKRQRDLGMPERFHHDPWMDALREQKRCRCVAQVMDA